MKIKSHKYKQNKIIAYNFNYKSDLSISACLRIAKKVPFGISLLPCIGTITVYRFFDYNTGNDCLESV